MKTIALLVVTFATLSLVGCAASTEEANADESTITAPEPTLDNARPSITGRQDVVRALVVPGIVDDEPASGASGSTGATSDGKPPSNKPQRLQ
jgi:hypothetical protein